MSNRTVLEVNNIGKRYTINHQAEFDSLRSLISNKIRRTTEILFSKKKNLYKSPINTRAQQEEFWALRNVTFNVSAGDRLGIVGRNGAGKSTLLKILSRVTSPSEGELIIRGKITSLLEIGTGFHPDLTGRENIFLNGSIMGMSKNEITQKFDQIVDFSEIERFLDTPVKHYSSGMQVRLAFSVAAHLQPDILILDEVLAVGDQKFQEKCIRRMEEISDRGCTVIFVSHSIDAVQKYCKRAILLSSGGVLIDTHDVKHALDMYVNG
jgi:lipopolysaccharide transport system ATP-binding protein